ncbi:LAFE_0H14818g1_1 [Lachancea fermentati]|uniref:LAFE_0H14818g1_1 n=1 Tax=Lachancea fermentati TaxID=4955 RepID=A0A1G4ML37_LACFM|nr:LAFE_0H14818g1_1 [Lachancea fermentati]
MTENKDKGKDSERKDSVDARASERRRTKVSRACDQCRSKKIRCDVSEENPICSGCKRAGKKCTFDRIPLKRGPSKGYTKNNESGESFDTSRRGSRKRSSSESRKWESPSNPGSVSLPPLAHYLPHPGIAAGPQQFASSGSSAAPQQQQFWKVPYHEYQYQRRSSIDSMGSDISTRQSTDQILYAPSNVSTNSTLFRASHPPPADECGFLDDQRRSPSIPPILRHPSTSSSQYQYPYSQFTLAQHQQRQQPNPAGFQTLQPPHPPSSSQQFKHFGNGFHSRKGSDVSEAVSPSSPLLAPQTHQVGTPSQRHGTDLRSGVPAEQQQSPAAAAASTSSGRDSGGSVTKRRKRSSVGRKKKDSVTSAGSLSSNHSNTITYGKIPDIQLIDTYYEFIHPNFPIIPINKRTLTDDLLLFNTQPLTSIHELNNYILNWFRNSLELLVRVSTKKPDISGSEFPNSNLDPLDSQPVFIAALNECFQKIVDVHPRFRESETLISPKVKFIYLSTFTILNFILAFVGYDNSFVLGMSVTIYNEFKLYRYLMFGEDIPDIKDLTEKNKSNVQTELVGELQGADVDEKKYHVLYKRLYVLLTIFDSLQSCSFGVPKLLSVPIQGVTAKLFKFSKDKWCVDYDPSRSEVILQGLALGELLSCLSMGRKSMCRTPLLLTSVECCEDIVASIFRKLLIDKHSFIDVLMALEQQDGSFRPMTLELSNQLTQSVCSIISCIHRLLTLIMKTNPTNSVDYNNRPHFHAENLEQTASPGETEPENENDNDNNNDNERENEHGHENENGHDNGSENERVENYDVYKKLLGLEGANEIDLTRGTISPFIISIVLEVYNLVDLIKHMPTSLIGVVVSTMADNSPDDTLRPPQELVMLLSNSMNDMVQITSLMNLLQPFKIFEFNRRKRRLSGLVMKRKETNPSQIAGSEDNILRKFVDVAWGLVDDEELGWV